MWANSVRLVSSGEPEYDDEGMETVKETTVDGVPASFTDVTRDDIILAQQSGYQADQTIILMACNYDGQRTVIDEATGDEYLVRRIFRANKSMQVQLTCERRERGGKL